MGLPLDKPYIQGFQITLLKRLFFGGVGEFSLKIFAGYSYTKLIFVGEDSSILGTNEMFGEMVAKAWWTSRE